MIIVKDMPQGSKEWVRLRLCVVTASGVNQILNFGQKTGWRHGGCDTWHQTEATALKCRNGVERCVEQTELTATLSAQRSHYRNQLLAEMATGAPVEKFMGNYWTERGQLLEGEAADYFTLQTDLQLSACAFIFKDESRTCGASPDMLVGTLDNPVAGLELKCPNAATHIGYLIDGRDAYEEQVQFSLWASGLPAWYFMSYHPDMPPYLEMVKPVEEYQRAFDTHILEFLSELRDCKDKLSRIGVNNLR